MIPYGAAQRRHIREDGVGAHRSLATPKHELTAGLAIKQHPVKTSRRLAVRQLIRPTVLGRLDIDRERSPSHSVQGVRAAGVPAPQLIGGDAAHQQRIGTQHARSRLVHGRQGHRTLACPGKRHPQVTGT